MENTRCERCKSTLTYIRIKTAERVCRWCGHVQKLEVGENANEETFEDKDT